MGAYHRRMLHYTQPARADLHRPTRAAAATRHAIRALYDIRTIRHTHSTTYALYDIRTLRHTHSTTYALYDIRTLRHTHCVRTIRVLYDIRGGGRGILCLVMRLAPSRQGHWL
jgi:hypothetical protein